MYKVNRCYSIVIQKYSSTKNHLLGNFKARFRSIERSAGGREVASSNLVAPTYIKPLSILYDTEGFFYLWAHKNNDSCVNI